MLRSSISVIKTLFPELTDLDELKSGGQKVVYSAKSEIFGDVVLKLVFNNSTDARIEREIDIVKNNNFENVPKIYEIGKREVESNEILYIIEEKINGDDLRAILNTEYHFSFQEVLKFVKQLISIIVELEKCSIVHRDIKPENILKDDDGKFWLIDFGIARDLNSNSLTATDANFGPHTAGYAAPEQLRNKKYKIDSRADLFSLGVVTYELLDGSNPFFTGARSIVDVLLKTESLSELPLKITEDTDGDFSQFIATLMKKSHIWRPPTASVAYSWFIELFNKYSFEVI